MTEKNMSVSPLIKQKQFLLFKSCSENNTKLIKELILDDKININKHDKYNNSPLFIAITQNYCKMAKLLISNNKVLINNTNFMGETPLSFACKHNRLKIAKYLLQREDLDINVKDIYHRTAIFNIFLSSNGYKYYDIMNIKQKYSINLNLRDKFGKTIIYYLINRKPTDYKLYISILQNPGLIIDQATYDYIKEQKNQCYLNYLLIYYPKIKELINIPKSELNLLNLKWNQSIINSNKIYALVILYTDEFLKKNNQYINRRITKFFYICSKLPIELQMIISNRCYRNNRNIITSLHLESQLRSLFVIQSVI